MDRRDFLKSTSGAAAAVATVGPVVAAASPNPGLANPHLAKGLARLTLTSSWRDGTAGFADSAHRLARRIEQMSGSQIRVMLIAEHAASRDADMLFGTENDRLVSHPAFAFFAGLPGKLGLAPADFDGWLTTGGGQMLWDDLAADAGLKPLLAGHTGAAPVLWSKVSIAGPQDFSGKRVFARGLAADVARGLGAQPAVMTGTEAVRAVVAGDLDIVEWGSLLQASADGVPQALPFGLPGGLSAGGTAISLNVARSAWDRLSAIHRMAIAAAAADEFRASVAESRAHDSLVARALAAQHGVRLHRPPVGLCDAVDRVAGAVVAHAASADRRAERINASYMQYRHAVTLPAYSDRQLAGS